MNIGKRIKQLRKEKSMTQERLAELLGISYQAISKWECGVSLPDISLIAPLTKIFGVTSDELLGINELGSESKKSKYDTLHKKFRHSNELNNSYWWAKDATIDFPNNYIYIEWLANCEYQLGFLENQKGDANLEYLNDMVESSLRHYEAIISACTDQDILLKAILGKITVLRFSERIIEAEWSAEFEYPDPNINTVNQALSLCDEGKKLLRYLETEN